MTFWMLLRAAVASRPARRLAFALAALVVADRFEPAVLRGLEAAHYEDPARDFRFENSDLFALGPLVSYLREHPHGQGRRVLFLGNSVTFGYGVGASEALPAGYQRLDTSAKVFNVGINMFPLAGSYLIAKATIDSVDLTYALLDPPTVAPVPSVLPRLIPVDEADLAQFRLPAPSETERILSGPVNHWRLYRDAYRLQAALFGSSTQQYLYLHKGAVARALIARLRAAERPAAASDASVTIHVPMSGAMPDEARQRDLRNDRPMLWRFGDLFRSRRRPVIMLQIAGYSRELADPVVGDFNRVYAPYAKVVVIHLPAQLTLDGFHLNGAGADQLARALWNVRPQDTDR